MSTNVTVNYGWVKPAVGADGDLWGGELNNNFDGIDSVVHGIQTSKYDATNPAGYQTAAQVAAALPPPSNLPPAMDGTAAPGSAMVWARGDHVHPTDTSRYAASNPSGYQTAAQVTATLAPYALTANVLPLSGGTLTGPLTLAADPTAALGAATKQYVDNKVLTTATWNPADLTNVTLSNSNLTATVPSGNGGVRAFGGNTSGRYYFECTWTLNTNTITSGLGLSSANLAAPTTGCIKIYRVNGNIFVNNTDTGVSINGGSPVPNNSVIGCAVDFSAHLVWFRLAPSGNWNGSGTANPATGAGGIDISSISTGPLYALMSGQTGDVVVANFGASAFSGVVPSGFTSGLQMGGYLPISGGTLTGTLTAPNIIAPQAIGDNRIINGDMRIDQRNNGASGTVNAVYTIDRWMYQANLANKGTWQRIAAWPSAGFPYALAFTSSSAYTPLVGDYAFFYQPIEADMVSDFAWGTANAQPATLSFWASSTLTGTFSGSIRNAANTRSYPFSYSLPVASTPTKIVITIPGDTAGTWTLSGNGQGMSVSFDLGTGATYRGAAGSWQSANIAAVTGAQIIVNTNGATFNVTGVKLEIGSVATPFNRQSLAKSLADCQRYYQIISVNTRSYAAAASSNINVGLIWFPMRAVPTMALFAVGTRGNATNLSTAVYLANSGALAYSSVSAGDTYFINDQWSLSAEL